mgnify:FL=1
MSTKLGEDTELTMPIKTIVMVVAFLISSSWYVFNTQSKISSLESDIAVIQESVKLNNEFRTVAPNAPQLIDSHTKVYEIQSSINAIKATLEMYANQPSRGHTDIEVLKSTVGFLQKQIDDIKGE